MNNVNNNALQPNTLLQGKAYTYTIQKVLGQGTFGITYLATTKVKVAGALGELETTIQVAIKEFFMKEINGREDNTVTSGSKGGVYDKYKKKFAREAENLSKLHHRANCIIQISSRYWNISKRTTPSTTLWNTWKGETWMPTLPNTMACRKRNA